jgi:hypothetical protein
MDWDPNSESFAEQEAQCVRAENTIDYVAPERAIYAIKCSHLEAPILTMPQEQRTEKEFLQAVAAKVTISATYSQQKKPSETIRDKITRIFGVGLETADRTLRATTQLALRHALHPIHRRYRTQVAQLRYPRLSGRHGKFHTDTFFSSTRSLSGCTMGQLYTNDLDFTKFYPMKRKSEAPDTLVSFMQDIGIPTELHSDDAKELTQGKMADIARQFWIRTTQSEPYSPWQVRAELCIREIKKAV